ncbi:probable 3-hydroxyacyl-CoA dehydrogenase B0272.3 [Oppia nitens]|uniref:probable 3-hydroxyacyl-CoA dehydrogenase B0272.3 n=1 Tax=Oppia nitens TaxID=1686743 RepID=UPI0023DBB544|nr:probable 3-hydroxyacyl-CoA dehydrogenase B0272.3 [Oppia nitens]
MSKLLLRQTLRLPTVLSAKQVTTGQQTAGQQLIRLFSKTAAVNRIENVLIIGSGLMGSGIAQSCATTERFNSITLQDVNNEQLAKAKDRITKSLNNLKEKKKVNINSIDEVVNRITLSTERKPVVDQNLLVIEAIPELLEPKQRIFKELCSQFKDNKSVIFVTNTSSLPCYEIGKYVDCKERFGGLHFFNPVPMMKLVEVIRVLDATNDHTFEALIQFVKDMDKVGVTCKDTPGFIVNRLLVPYMQEAVALLERGDATARDIDIAMKLGAGYPMGPFELMDYVGLDTNKFIVDAWAARGDPNLKIYKSKLIESMVAKGHLGKKTGKGFYDYTKK